MLDFGQESVSMMEGLARVHRYERGGGCTQDGLRFCSDFFFYNTSDKNGVEKHPRCVFMHWHKCIHIGQVFHRLPKSASAC